MFGMKHKRKNSDLTQRRIDSAERLRILGEQEDEADRLLEERLAAGDFEWYPEYDPTGVLDR